MSNRKIYTCPMHPEMQQNQPGMCPECGMRLVPAESKKGQQEHKPEGNYFDKHAGHSTNVFKIKFWISLLLSIPVVLYSDVAKTLLRWTPPQFSGSEYLPFTLSSIIFFYGGWIFLASAWRELRAKLPGMMTLISLAILTAYSYSVYAAFSRSGGALFWELSTLITVMLLGHWMEMKAVQGAQGALRELSKLLPDTAEVIRNGNPVIILLEEVKEGDVVLVKPGGKIPTDGVVIEGSSDVNESLATGESRPVSKTTKSEVIAGTINGDGSLKIKVTKIGEHTFLAGVMRLVQEAQTSKSKLQMLSDRAAYYLTIVAVVTGSVTLASWLASNATAGFAIERMVAVLVIACPHALGLAIPLVASISTTKAARNGFLVRRRLALEAARNIDIVLFDKTGTLTRGEYGVTDVWPIAENNKNKVLELAASVDASSEHPISKAIVKKAKELNLSFSEGKNFRRLPGKGSEAEVAGKKIIVGSAALAEELKFANPKEVGAENKKGKTIIYVIRDKEVLGIIALADLVRSESVAAIKELKEMGVQVAMITGDSEEVAKWVAGELGVDEYFARVLPDQKSSKVKMLQSKGKRVAMVGDGINDAPALAQADLGVAIGAGTNVAIESAGIILVRNDPRDIAKIIRLSRLTYTKMIQNLFWAAGYNIIAIPLAAGVLASRGILLQPALSAFLMSLSTVIVAVNALFLKRSKLS